MEPNFDKEIDALLRRTAQVEQSSAQAANGSNRPHLDADEISAFAENALPGKVRQRYLVHLADCDPCRINLSNLISLNSQTRADQFVSEKETLVTVGGIARKIPWYRKLLATPKLAFAMGALVIFFAGITVFTVWQSQSGYNNVAKIENRQDKPGTASNSSAPANTALPAANTASDADGGAPANTSGNSVDTPGELVGKTGPQSGTVPGEQNIPTGPQPTNNEVYREDPADSPTPERRPDEKLGEVSADKDLKTVKNENKKVADEIASGEARPAPNTAPGPRDRKSEPAKEKRDKLTVRSGTDEEAQEDDNTAQPTRQISGKTFKRTDGVWYDADYKNQTTTNVRRGTGQYKNLDSGLRSIAEKLNGTIVVVWKSKAYRIQ